MYSISKCIVKILYVLKIVICTIHTRFIIDKRNVHETPFDTRNTYTNYKFQNTTIHNTRKFQNFTTLAYTALNWIITCMFYIVELEFKLGIFYPSCFKYFIFKPLVGTIFGYQETIEDSSKFLIFLFKNVQ